MPTVLRRTTVIVACASLLLTACTNASAAHAPTSAGLTWSGSPDERSATWATDLDPNSRYGLHERKGLPTVLRPGTAVLSASDAAKITDLTIDNRAACLSDTDSHPMCRFTLNFSSLPSGIHVGSVLNSGITPSTPNGLLIRVTAITGHTVQAVQATLRDALVSGEFWIEHTFKPDQLRGKPTLAPGVTMVPRTTAGGTKGSSVRAVVPSINDVSLPGALKISVTPVTGVTLTGSLDFGAGCGLDGGVGGSDIAWIEVSCHAWEQAGLSVSADANGLQVKKDYPIADIPFAAFPIPIGPIVVVVIVDMLITVDINGTVHAHLQYGATEHAEVSGGLRFSIGHGLDHDGGVHVSGSSTKTGGLAASVSASALGRAELRLSAYGVLGFGVGGEASVSIDGGPSQNPRWRLYGNAGIYARVFLGIVGFELTAKIAYHLKNPFQIDQYHPVPPDLTITWPPDGTVITKGALPRQVDATATDEVDGVVPVTWEDITDHVTVSGTTPQTLPFTKLGWHTLRISAKASSGLTASTLIGVKVVPPTPGVTLTLRNVSGAAVGTHPTVTKGTTLLADATLTSTALTTPSCSLLSWTATNATVTTDGSCRAHLTLTGLGTATITATLTDSYGTTVSATRTVNVLLPRPGPVAPVFEGIDVTSKGAHLNPGDSLIGDAPITLKLTYLNYDQAKIRPAYSWSYTVGSQPPATMPRPPGMSIITVSTRAFTPPTAYGFTATFTVVVKNADTGATLTTRSFTVHWQSLPR
jgi:hypothetical protein